MLRGENNASLLGCGDAGSGAAVTSIATQAHLDENERFSIAADEVDFAAATAEIARQYGESSFFEKSRRAILGSVTDHFGRFRSWYRCCSLI